MAVVEAVIHTRATGVTNDTTLLLGLDGLAAERMETEPGGGVVVHLVTADADAARCRSCQVASSTSPKERVVTRPRDLPHGGRGIKLLWHKRRWRCRNPECSTGSFTEPVAAVPARARLTTRLRAAAVADRGATVVQAGRDLQLSWPTVVVVCRMTRLAPSYKRTTPRLLR
jgi:transposase